MKYLLQILMLLFFSYSINAQMHPGFSKTYSYSGDTVRRAETITSMIYDSTANSIYFTTYGSTFTDLYHKYGMLFKVDLQGNVLKTVIDTMTDGGMVYQSVVASKDGKFLYWGASTYDVNHLMDSSMFKIRKTDKDLNVIWDKYYNAGTVDKFSAAFLALDSGQILQLGIKWTPTNSWGIQEQSSRILLRKIDNAGNELAVYNPVDWDYTEAYAIEKTEDGGFLINGYSYSKSYVLKTDADGNYLWHQNYCTDANASWLTGMKKQTGISENYLISGQVTIDADRNAVGLASKINAQGNVIWEKRIAVNSVAETLYDVANSSNESSAWCGSVYFPDVTAARGWMVRLDKDGEQVWNKLYSYPHPAGFHDYLYKVAALPDGGFIAAGSTFGQDANGYWTQDGWLLRVDSNGCYNPDCSTLVSVKDVKLTSTEIRTYPNPTANMLYLERGSIFPKNTVVTLMDYLGRVIKQLPSPSGKTKMEYNFRGLSPNVYFLKIDIDGKVINQKFVISS